MLAASSFLTCEIDPWQTIARLELHELELILPRAVVTEEAKVLRLSFLWRSNKSAHGEPIAAFPGFHGAANQLQGGI